MGVGLKLAATAGGIATVVLLQFGPADAWPFAAAPTAIVAGVEALNERGGRKLRRRGSGGVKAVEDGATDNHGHARWQTMKEAICTFPGPAQGYGGIVVGEAYRVDQDGVAAMAFIPRDRKTWGRGGKAKLLIDPCTDGQTHNLLFAGSGGFKTTSAISTILHWTGSSVILDPSCEVGPMVAEALTDKHGKQVHFLDPIRPEDAETWGFDALDWIEPGDPLAEMHVHTVVSWIFGETDAQATTEEQQFFRRYGKDLVATLLADLIWDKNPRAPRTLATLRAGVATPEADMRVLLRAIYRTSGSLMARHLAGTIMDFASDQFSGVYGTANQGTSWLSVPAFADLISGDAFKSSDLADGGTTVFVQIPLAALVETPALGRVIIGSLLNSIYRKEGRVNGRVLFLFDEIARVGRMKILETARDAGRKYGITLSLFYQSVGQLEEQWGRAGKRAWYDGVSWRAYAAVQDLDTARELSALCGKRGVLAYSEGENSGKQNRTTSWSGGSRSKGQNLNVHEIGRPLILPEEITQDMRGDEMIVIPRSARPIRCGRPIYFRRPELRAQVNVSKFA